MYTRCSLKESLKTGVYEIEFLKGSGETRKIKCTLNPELLPPYVEGKRKKADNENILAVFDLDKNDWRSFRVVNVISAVEVKNEKES